MQQGESTHKGKKAYMIEGGRKYRPHIYALADQGYLKIYNLTLFDLIKKRYCILVSMPKG